ncbi:MAG TPA: DUF1800 domain-containing protein [Vicinamibacteria bacterium]|nr:DUF1800 domain-containing protein [Vicinamibacteria bacterium]
MSRRTVGRSHGSALGALALSASLGLFLPLVATAAERPNDVPRRAETLERLKAKYPDFRFRLDPAESDGAGMDMGEAAPVGAFGAAAALEGTDVRATATAVGFDQQRLLAGHLLRHATFGPSPSDVTRAVRMGPTRWVDWQLGLRGNPGCAGKLPRVNAKNIYNDWERLKRWYARTVCAQDQLNEKMTLIWHELFATSNEKVGVALLMDKQEVMLRRYALTNFRNLLLNITTDQAMMVFLDNDPNSGTLRDENGNKILPNRNYAREFQQLFSVGPVLLNMDGTPIVDGSGIPVPTYTEEEVNDMARALTGWEVDWRKFTKAKFIPGDHDPDPKTILGVPLPGRPLKTASLEVRDVVDVVMQHPNLAPFISKYLIQKLATERPSPAYVERVATVFKERKGDLRRTVRAILLDPEFSSDANLRAGYKEPIEHFVGAARALSATTDGAAFIEWTALTKQLLYYPPSVFSFYPPGQKRQLVNTATVTYRDRGADQLAAAWWSIKWDANALIKKNKITTPEMAVDWLSDALLVGPLQPEVRQRIVDYMGGGVNQWKFRGAVWLIMASPDFQRQ